MDQKIDNFVEIKLAEINKKKEEDIEETLINRKKTVNSNYKCNACSLTFGTLTKHFQVNHPKTVKCNSCDATFDQICKL